MTLPSMRISPQSKSPVASSIDTIMAFLINIFDIDLSFLFYAYYTLYMKTVGYQVDW
jgi:hypothetical protein